ncbi:SDR family oxidoreductase [Rhodoferax sp. PAMC 29310]|uniref:SDR family NAD(P)-dependent oxidoreductase n=1 Tax=Rhodoferax sp. PAMC 29310 TaxID=2822760 RepID=UPI001B32E323|nr:SDR family oxidoreductase [Rhodoferax sp. PAMC 29310]
MKRTSKATNSHGSALITGASSGIGEALAQRFAAAGFDLVIVARNQAKLQVLSKQMADQHGISVKVVSADLAQPGAATRLHSELARQKCPVNVLVNCAGVLEQGLFTAIDAPSHQQIIDLNISGLTAMLHAFLPGMVTRGQGRVLNVASVAAFQPVPSLASYAASKAYVLSLSESLAEELRGTGVTVTALCPGITATAMLAQAAGSNGKLGELPDFLVGDAGQVADNGFAACMRGDAICVPGMVNSVAMVASRATPKWLVRRLGGLLGRKAM